MKKAKNGLAAVLALATLCVWGGVLTGCDTPAESRRHDNEYVNDNTYASDFYSTQYIMDYVRDVQRDPAIPTQNDKSLNVYNPRNPCLPDDRDRYSDDELKNIKYFVLSKSSEKDLYDEYAVSASGEKEKIGTGGKIMCFGKEGFLYLCGGSDGTYYGTFFFTKYGYDKFTASNNDMTYEFDKLNLGHSDISEIFGSAN